MSGARPSDGQLLFLLALGLLAVGIGTKMVKASVFQLGWNRLVATVALGAVGWLAS